MVIEPPPVRRVRWRGAARIIRSRYPPVDLFDDIADPEDWELILSAESKTNPRVREAVGDLRLVPPERRISGPGASWVMAAFTHVSPERRSRFSDGSYGVYYAGNRFEVALLETVHHFEAFMRRTAEAPSREDFRVLVGEIDHAFHDLRNDPRFADYLDPDDYGKPQAFARELRQHHGSDGLVYPSVRCPGGQAVGAFWPDAVGRPRQAEHLQYHWNGSRVDRYFVYGEEAWRAMAERA